MTLVTSGTCRLCGSTRSFSELGHYTSTIFGAVVDLGMYDATLSGTTYETTQSGTTTFFCNEDGACWDTVQHSEAWHNPSTGRIWQEHDQFKHDCRVTISGISLATLSGMISLHPDYALTESGVARFDEDIRPNLGYKYIDEWLAAGLDDSDAALCCQILRNECQLPTWSGFALGYNEYYG
jgi:hypothetical protein